MKIIRTYTIRLFPTNKQQKQLQQLSTVRNMLYNIIVDKERAAFQNKQLLTEYDLNNLLPTLKKQQPILKTLNSKAGQRVCKEVYSSFKSFFTLIKKDPTAKPPQSIDDVSTFHTVVFNQSGWKFISNSVIRLNGMELYFKSMPNVELSQLFVKEVKLKYKNNKYLLDVSTETEINTPTEINVQNKVLAIDLGLKTLVTGVDNLGNVVVMNNKAKKIGKYFSREIKRVKSKMSSKTKYSRSWKHLNSVKKRLYRRRNGQVKDALHVQSKKLVSMNYKTIVVGDLEIKKLQSKKGVNKRKRNVRKSFSEACIARFLEYLTYKSLSCNNEVITISERWTTQTNCLTGKLFKDKVELNERIVRLDANTVIDRDLNAAINIMRRYEQNHLALMTTPLDVSNVVSKHNLDANP